MKLFKKLLRYWIAIASVLSFLGGWIILAHSPKPVLPGSTASQSLAALPPIQAYGNDINNNGLGFFSNNAPANSQTIQPNTGFPRLRTRGS